VREGGKDYKSSSARTSAGHATPISQKKKKQNQTARKKEITKNTSVEGMADEGKKGGVKKKRNTQ